jgi:hypothetical protein
VQFGGVAVERFYVYGGAGEGQGDGIVSSAGVCDVTMTGFVGVALFFLFAPERFLSSVRQSDDLIDADQNGSSPTWALVEARSGQKSKPVAVSSR